MRTGPAPVRVPARDRPRHNDKLAHLVMVREPPTAVAREDPSVCSAGGSRALRHSRLNHRKQNVRRGVGRGSADVHPFHCRRLCPYDTLDPIAVPNLERVVIREPCVRAQSVLGLRAGTCLSAAVRRHGRTVSQKVGPARECVGSRPGDSERASRQLRHAVERQHSAGGLGQTGCCQLLPRHVDFWSEFERIRAHVLGLYSCVF